MTRRFDAVLFDFGGVIVTSPFDLIGQAGRHTGVEPDVVLEVMMGDYAEDNDHPWHRLERGEISMQEYGAFLISSLAERKIDLDLSKLGSFYGQLEVHPTMVETVRRLREEGYRTALVTNNAREAGDAWRSMVPLGELFEVVIDSCQVGLRKPNPAIYELALAELGGIAPDRAVFLDDAEGNVEGARRAGMAAILVQDPETAIAELDALLTS
jgi:putative hydrolase of the HAD superfamily